jgi:hypothetical protein
MSSNPWQALKDLVTALDAIKRLELNIEKLLARLQKLEDRVVALDKLDAVRAAESKSETKSLRENVETATRAAMLAASSNIEKAVLERIIRLEHVAFPPGQPTLQLTASKSKARNSRSAKSQKAATSQTS